MNLRERVKKTIESYSMLNEGSRVVVALSGGVDSVVLLHILMDLKDHYRLSLCVAHLNHSLRGEESERDALFVEGLAKDFNLPFFNRKVEPSKVFKKGFSIHEAARRVRYEFLYEVMEEFKADRIALGHHRDDQAETVIMRFIMGSGLSGLKGMTPCRGSIIRPLFEVGRDDILLYAREKGLKYVMDTSNVRERYLRNRVRLKLIPFIKDGFNPNISETLFRLSKVLERDHEFLESEAEKAFDKVVSVLSPDNVTLNLKILISFPDAIKARILKKAWEGIAGRKAGLYSCHIDALLYLLKSPLPNLKLTLPLSIGVYKEYGHITFKKGCPIEHPTYEYNLNIPGLTEIPEVGLALKADIVSYFNFKEILGRYGIALFDYDSLRGPFIVRSFRAGDRIRPFGMEGSKKLKDLFIDLKIPIKRRREIPILVGKDEVIWLVGVRRSSIAPVREDTKRILKVEIIEQTLRI